MLTQCVKTLTRPLLPLILALCLIQPATSHGDDTQQIRELAQAFSALADAAGLRPGLAALPAHEQQAVRDRFDDLAQASDFGQRVRDQIEANRIRELRAATGRRAAWALSAFVSAPFISTFISTAAALAAPSAGDLGVLLSIGTGLYTLGTLAWAAKAGAAYYTLPAAMSPAPVTEAEMNAFFDELRRLGWQPDGIQRPCGIALLGE